MLLAALPQKWEMLVTIVTQTNDLADLNISDVCTALLAQYEGEATCGKGGNNKQQANKLFAVKWKCCYNFSLLTSLMDRILNYFPKTSLSIPHLSTTPPSLPLSCSSLSLAGIALILHFHLRVLNSDSFMLTTLYLHQFILYLDS